VSDTRPARRFSPAALWATACLLAALIIVQAGRMGPGPARADVVSTAAGTTALTFEATNEDLLAVIDGRQEALFVYRVENRVALDLIRSYQLPALFSDARSRAGGTGRVR
jgi:hypothetical protein